ncbi:MAG: DNA polymerase III subunit delta [Campylobacterales bacterium]
MDKRELDTHLKTGKPIKSAMLFGACDYLADMYMESIIETAGVGCDMLKMYFDEYSFEEAKSFISQNSLFGDKLVLLIKNDKKIPKTELKELIALSAKNDALFVFRFMGDLTTKDKDYYELFSSADSFFVRFFAPNSIYEAAGYVKNEADKKNIAIKKEAIEELLTLKNMDIEGAVKELEKFEILGREIGLKEIRDFVDESDDAALEKFFEEVLDKKEFYKTLLKILEKAEFDEIRLVLFFQNYIHELFLFLLYSKAYGSYDAKKITGRPLPDFVAKAKAAKAIKIKYGSYARILEILLEADLSLKNSKNGDKKATLLHYLIKLQNNL